MFDKIELSLFTRLGFAIIISLFLALSIGIFGISVLLLWVLNSFFDFFAAEGEHLSNYALRWRKKKESDKDQLALVNYLIREVLMFLRKMSQVLGDRDLRIFLN